MPRALRAASLALACACALAHVASAEETEPTAPSSEVAAACSRVSPAMQSAVLEAVVYGGGPLAVDVVGWMCGRARGGAFVRIVMLRYPVRDSEGRPTGGGELVPVVFEESRLVAHGWRLFEIQPGRYGVPLPTRDEPWRVPPGWVVLRSERELA